MADKARIHSTDLSDVERGTRNLSFVKIEQIATALDWSVAELFETVENGG